MPSLRLQRLKDELDGLEAELRTLEREDVATKYQQVGEAKASLNEVEYLKLQIQDIVSSDALKNLEGRTPFDDIMDEYKEDKLKLGLDTLLAQNLSILQPSNKLVF